MVEQLATDPGVWNIIWWTIVLVAVASGILWAVSTFFLSNGWGSGPGEKGGSPTDHQQ
jgi:hypothetical protein